MIQKSKLELMFMKHYAPNRCLYIKKAKLRTGMGSAEMSHLQNCSLKIYLKRALGGGGVGFGGRGGQDGCERRIKVFVKIQKNIFFFGGGGGGGGWVREVVNREVKFLRKLKKNCVCGGGVQVWGGGVRVDVNEELKFL